MNVFCPGCGARFSIAPSPIDPDPSATCPKCKSKFSTAGVTETAERVEPKRKLKPKKAGNSGAGVVIAAIVILVLGGTAGGLWYAGVFKRSESRGVGSALQSGWREVAIAEGKFRVLLPDSPKRIVRSKREIEFRSDTPEYQIQVVFADLNDKENHEKFMAAPHGSKIIRDKEITVGDYKGRDLVIQLGSNVVHLRHLIVGKRLYTVLIAGKNGNEPKDADVTRLIDSFQVTG